MKHTHHIVYSVCSYGSVTKIRSTCNLSHTGQYGTQTGTCSTGNPFEVLFKTFHSPPVYPLLHSHLLCSAVMPASKVINDCGFGSLSWVFVEDSLCKLQMFGVKARLYTQKNYGCVKCEFVIGMIKGSLRGIVYHTTPKKTTEWLLEGVWIRQM